MAATSPAPHQAPTTGRARPARQPRPDLVTTVEFIAGRPMPGALRQLLNQLDNQGGRR